MEGLWQVYTITGSLQKRPFFILGGKKQCSITLDPSIKKPALISLNIKRLGFFQDIIESLAFFPPFLCFYAHNRISKVYHSQEMQSQSSSSLHLTQLQMRWHSINAA